MREAREAKRTESGAELDAALTSDPFARTHETTLTLERLQQLEWKRFEVIVARWFESLGYRAVGSGTGADGGVDIWLYRPGEQRAFAVVQRKAWTNCVGPKLVRELAGVVSGEGVETGYFVTTSAFTRDALNDRAAQKLTLIDGTEFVRRFNALPEPKRAEIVAEIYAGDFSTPSCPTCGVKLVRRASGADRSTFWDCPNFPRCNYTMRPRVGSWSDWAGK